MSNFVAKLCMITMMCISTDITNVIFSFNFTTVKFMIARFSLCVVKLKNDFLLWQRFEWRKNAQLLLTFLNYAIEK